MSPSHCTISAKAPGSFVAVVCSFPGVGLTGVVYEWLKLGAANGRDALERDGADAGFRTPGS